MYTCFINLCYLGFVSQLILHLPPTLTSFIATINKRPPAKNAESFISQFIYLFISLCIDWLCFGLFFTRSHLQLNQKRKEKLFCLVFFFFRTSEGLSIVLKWSAKCLAYGWQILLNSPGEYFLFFYLYDIKTMYYIFDQLLRS